MAHLHLRPAYFPHRLIGAHRGSVAADERTGTGHPHWLGRRRGAGLAAIRFCGVLLGAEHLVLVQGAVEHPFSRTSRSDLCIQLLAQEPPTLSGYRCLYCGGYRHPHHPQFRPAGNQNNLMDPVRIHLALGRCVSVVCRQAPSDFPLFERYDR